MDDGLDGLAPIVVEGILSSPGAGPVPDRGRIAGEGGVAWRVRCRKRNRLGNAGPPVGTRPEQSNLLRFTDSRLTRIEEPFP